MTQQQQNIETLCVCFREIAKMLPRAGDIDAFIAGIPPEMTDSMDVCMNLADKLKLAPEHRSDVTVDELASYFGAPIFLQLKNKNWVIFLGVRKQIIAGKEEERFAIFDPLSETKGKMLFLKNDQLAKAWECHAVFLKIELQGCSVDGRHTSLYSLAAIVKHHGGDTDVARLIHDYAVSEDEPALRLLKKMAEDLDFSAKEITASWDKLKRLGGAFPCMGFKRDGTSAILCGMRAVPVSTVKQALPDAEVRTTGVPPPAEPVREQIATDAEKTAPEPKSDIAKVELETPMKEPELKYELAVWDPIAKDGRRPAMKFIPQDEFEKIFSGHILLLKKHYSILDEDQPFGLRWFIPEFYRQRTLLGQVALAILSISLIGLVIPLFFQLVVDKVLLHQSYNTLTVLTVAVVVALVFNAALDYLEKYFLLYATNRIDIRLAIRTFAKLLSLPVDFYERISSGVLLKHMQQTERIRSFLSGSLFFSILELLSLVVFLPFLLVYSARLTLIVLFFTFLMALVIALLIRPFQVRLEELYMAEGKRQGMLVETIHGIRTVKSLALEPTQQRKWNDTAAFAITRYFRVAKISIAARTICDFLEKAMFVAVIAYGAKAVFDHTLTVGELIAFQMLSGRVTGPLVHIVGLVHEYQQTALSVKMLGVVMNCPGEQVGGSLHHQLRGELSIDNVNFQYTPDGPRVIKDFTLHIAPGTTVGLVGRSGSGKTTLTKLIQGLYPLQGGIIKFDGIDIREIDRSSLRSNIGIVLQDNYFFHGTVRENLSLTKKEASMEEVIYASRMAGADEFVQKMSRGYDSMLEENASNLSGGQRQRLAIARALLPNPRFLIFDEATSALDPESETLVRRNLKLIARNRTVFIISHRLSVLCRANQIVVMDKGELKEQGTHAELIAKKGIYAEFWRQQMGTEDDV